MSEALGLTWGDVDFDALTITVTAQLGINGERVLPKTTASRAAVPSCLRRSASYGRTAPGKRVVTYGSRTGTLWCSRPPVAKPQSRRNALRAVQQAGDELGLNGEGQKRVGLHDLRHSFVAIALVNGVTLPEAAMLARHANPA